MEGKVNIIEQVKSFLQPKVITINSAANYEGLPKGFFNVQTASGKKYLGYNGGFLAWSVGAVVVDGGKRIAAPENREELPTVILNFTRPQQGVQHVAGHSIIETDALDGDNSTVIWEGKEPPSGIGWH